MGIEALDKLGEALAALEAVDVSSLSDEQLHELCIGTHKACQRLGADAGLVTAVWDKKRVWASNQCLSAKQRSSNELKCDVVTARRELRRARKLTHMPHTAQAVRDGRLSLDLLDALGRANSGRRTKLFGEHEEALVNEIAGLRYRDGLIAISYWKIHANELLGVPEPPDEPATAFMSPVGDRWALSADLEAIAGTIVSDELDRLVGQIALADKKAGIERPTSQRRALALVAMALRSCSAPGSGSMRRPLFSVHIGDGTVANMCELSNGTVIQPAKLAPWIDTALLEVMLFSGKFTVIAASKRRTFTGALRRAIEVRDRHCQHPSGCDTPAEKCDVNHIVAVEHGGKTTQFNGNLECPPHNRLAHLHDDGGEPIPETGVTYLEQLRARLRWQYLRDYPDEAA